MRRSFEHLQDVVDAVVGAQTLPDALRALGESLPAFHEVNLVAIARYAQDSIEVVASWSASGRTLFTPGTVVSTAITSGVRVASETVRGGRLVSNTIDGAGLGLLGDAARAEGVVSWIAVPLHEGKRVRGLLTISSRSEEGMAEEHVPFFTGVGRGVEHRLLELLDRA